LSLPAEIIRGGSFQIKVINKLDPNLIKFDVFSHLRAFTINDKYQKVRKIDFKNIADKLLKYVSFMAPFIKKIYRNYRYKAKSQRLSVVSELDRFNECLPDFVNIYRFSGSLGRLKNLLIGIKYVNMLSQKD